MVKSGAAIIISLVLAAAAVVIAIQLTRKCKVAVKAVSVAPERKESYSEAKSRDYSSGSSSSSHKKLFPQRASRSGLSDSWKLSLDMTERLTSHGASTLERPIVFHDPVRKIGSRPGFAMLRKALTPPPVGAGPQMVNPNFM